MFERFISKSKNMFLKGFSSCCTRFLEHCGANAVGSQLQKQLNQFGLSWPSERVYRACPWCYLLDDGLPTYMYKPMSMV